MSSPRHLLVIELDLEPYGGAERSLLELCRALADRGHAISLVYVRAGSLLSAYEEFARNIQQIPWTSDKEPPALVLGRSFKIAYATRRLHPDLVYVNGPHGLQYAWLTAATRRLPLICHLRTPVFYSRRWLAALPFVTGAIAVSEATASGYASLGLDKQKIEVIHNAVGIDEYRLRGNREDIRRDLGLESDAYAVLYLGRLEREKGIEVLIDAFRRLLQTSPHARLVVAGDPLLHGSPDARLTYLRSLKDLAPKEATIWLKRRADVVALYEAADVVVVPSLWEEPFARVVLEAMACQRPILASRTGGLSEILRGPLERFLFEKGNARQLATELSRLENWQTKEPSLGRSLREHVGRVFNLEQQTEKVEAHFDRAVRNGPTFDLRALSSFRRRHRGATFSEPRERNGGESRDDGKDHRALS